MFAPLLFYLLFSALRFYAALWNVMISPAKVDNMQYTSFCVLCQLLKSVLDISNFQIESFPSIWIKFIIKIIFSYLKNASPLCGTIGSIEPLVFHQILQKLTKLNDNLILFFCFFFSLMKIWWNNNKNNRRCRISFQLQMPSVFNVKIIITKFEIHCWRRLKGHFFYVNRLKMWIQ